MSVYLYLLNECDLSVSGTVLWPNLKAAVEKELAMAASTWGSYSTAQYSTVQYRGVHLGVVLQGAGQRGEVGGVEDQGQVLGVGYVLHLRCVDIDVDM